MDNRRGHLLHHGSGVLYTSQTAECTHCVSFLCVSGYDMSYYRRMEDIGELIFFEVKEVNGVKEVKDNTIPFVSILHELLRYNILKIFL